MPAPADLASAIAARLPTIELVPESCGDVVAVAITPERVCLGDPSGRTRAMRRFATSSIPSVGAARMGDEIIFGVIDAQETTTRYDGRLWTWDLRSDSYRAVFALDPAEDYLAEVITIPVGVLIRTSHRAWIYDGTLSALRASDVVVEEAVDARIVVVDQQMFEIRTDAGERVVFTLRRDGARMSREELTRFTTPPDPARGYYVSGEAIRADGTIAWVSSGSLVTMHLPSPEVASVPLERVPSRIFWVGDGLHAVTSREGLAEEWIVDPATGALTGTALTLPVFRPQPRSIHTLAITRDGVSVALGEARWALSASGVVSRRRVPGRVASRCACHDTTLACGRTEIVGACTEVAELESIDGAPATFYDARYRVDRLEPDHARITRLSDGARLWIRVLDDVVFAQADDGAFAAGDLSSEGWSVRWGRDLLGAPVTALAPVRAQLERPSLVADFFAGNALPAADTTLP